MHLTSDDFKSFWKMSLKVCYTTRVACPIPWNNKWSYKSKSKCQRCRDESYGAQNQLKICIDCKISKNSILDANQPRVWFLKTRNLKQKRRENQLSSAGWLKKISASICDWMNAKQQRHKSTQGASWSGSTNRKIESKAIIKTTLRQAARENSHFEKNIIKNGHHR